MSRTARRLNRPSPPLAVQRREDRTTPAGTISLSGTAVTFTLPVGTGGALRHNVLTVAVSGIANRATGARPGGDLPFDVHRLFGDATDFFDFANRSGVAR